MIAQRMIYCSKAANFQSPNSKLQISSNNQSHNNQNQISSFIIPSVLVIGILVIIWCLVLGTWLFS